MANRGFDLMSNNEVPNLFDIMEDTLKLHGDMSAFLGNINGLNHEALGIDAFPDSYGCEKYFKESFVNEEMSKDFPLIAKDFLYNEYENLENYEMIDFIEANSGEDSPEVTFEKFIVNLMVNAVDGGSDYARALILYLYKTYYKKEYNSLKKFNSLSVDELMSLSKPSESDLEYRNCMTCNVARILYIAKLSGKDINPNCNGVYSLLNRNYELWKKSKRDGYSDELAEIHIDTMKEVEEKYSMDRFYALDIKASEYLGGVLKWAGYDEEYVDVCDDNETTLLHYVATTLDILRKTYPSKKEYTEAEILPYLTILRAVSALTCNSDWMTENWRYLIYGTKSNEFYDLYPPKFNPDDITVRKKANKPSILIEHEVPSKNIENYLKFNIDNEKLKEDIEALRKKAHKLEENNKELSSRLSDRRKLEEDNKNLKDELETANRELAVLRNFVYNLTESEEKEEAISIEKMKEEIKDMRIVIIGGHPNWTYKVKKAFPNWVFVNPDATGSTDPSIVDKADKVYFFTDIISHSNYYRYMNIVKDRKVNFGYIHGVNIEKNIKQIYLELIE